MNMKIKGLDSLRRKLKTLAAAQGENQNVKMGYQNGATFPNGTSVAMVAAIQNFGASGASIPARPFFTNMILMSGKHWSNDLGVYLKETKWNGDKALAMLGEEMVDDLRLVVRETNYPALSPITVMLRDMRSQGEEITGASVGEAARRVAAGESNHGASTKPLIDTPAEHLVNSVTYVVNQP